MTLPDTAVHAQERSKEARFRILSCALELFANQGYSKTSTREIAQKAKVNLSAIKYYFGDKEGLYNATCDENIGPKEELKAQLNKAQLSSASVLETFQTIMFNFVAPLKEDKLVKLRIKLHMREFIEPTGLRPVVMDEHLKPHYDLIEQTIRSEFEKEKIKHLENYKSDIQQLTFSILSLPIFLFMGRDLIETTAPELIVSSKSIDDWTAKLALYASYMLQAQAQLIKKSQVNQNEKNKKGENY